MQKYVMKLNTGEMFELSFEGKEDEDEFFLVIARSESIRPLNDAAERRLATVTTATTIAEAADAEREDVPDPDADDTDPDPDEDDS